MKIKKIVTLMMGLSFSLCAFAQDDWQLVWSDEFDADGPLNSSVWNFEQGYARNEEAQQCSLQEWAVDNRSPERAEP